MDGYWTPEKLRQLAADKHVGQKAMILRCAADILEAEDAAAVLRGSIRNYMEDLDGWYDLPIDTRKLLVDTVAVAFETQKTQRAPKGFAAAPPQKTPTPDG